MCGILRLDIPYEIDTCHPLFDSDFILSCKIVYVLYQASNDLTQAGRCLGTRTIDNVLRKARIESMSSRVSGRIFRSAVAADAIHVRLGTGFFGCKRQRL